MATTQGKDPDSLAPDSPSVWRKRVAVALALTLAAGGLLLLERNPASAASAPRVVHAVHHTPLAAGAADVRAQLAPLSTASSQLRGAASLLTQTLPALDATSRAQTADLAASANQAAGLSQQLASAATSSRSAATASALAGQVQAAMSATAAKAAAVSRAPAASLISFCNFTIQIGPIVINIPTIGLHLVIGPFFVHFRAPCFLSGRIPTHVG
jgi:hypothetical protein